MKNLILITFIGITSISFGQMGFHNNPTWLYKYPKSERYSNEWTIEGSFLEQGQTEYSIYYAKGGNWTYVGKLSTHPSFPHAKVYFKNGYRVAYAKEDEKPTEIVFKTKQWKVE